MTTNQRLRWPSLVAAATLLFGAVCAQAQEEREIGTTSAVNPQATGFPPVSPERQLVIGADVVTDERVVTTADGQAQMLFLDGSALTIGPNSQVTLDKFVYDPDTKTGELAFTATKGLFRLVGGRISKTTQVVFKTPTATIGIRGGIVIIGQQEAGPLDATYLFGEEATVTNEKGAQTMRRPGFTVSVAGPDAAPSAPVLASIELLSNALNGLEGRPDATGGAAEAPTEEGVEGAAGGVADDGSDVEPEDQTTADEVLTAAVDEFDPVVVALEGPVNAGGSGTPEEESEVTLASQSAEGAPGAPSGAISAGGFSGRYKTNPGTGTTFGTGDEFAALNIPFSGGIHQGGRFTVPAINWDTPIQVGAFSFSSSGTNSPFGPVDGTGFFTSDQQFVFFEVNEIDFPGETALLWAGIPTSSFPTSGVTFYSLQNDFTLGSNIPFIPGATVSLSPPEAEGTADTGIAWDISGSSTAQRAWGHRTIVISGQGTSQQSAISLIGGSVETDSSGRLFLEGGMVGSARLGASSATLFFDSEAASVDDGLGNDFFGPNADYFVLDSTHVDGADTLIDRGAIGPIGGVDQTYFPNNVALATTATLATRTSRQMFGYTGGAMLTISSGGTFIDTTLFNDLHDPASVEVFTSAETNKVQAAFDVEDASSPGAFLLTDFGDLDPAFGDSTSTTGESAFIDDTLFGAGGQEGASAEADFVGTLSGLTIFHDELYMVVVRDTNFNANFFPSGVTVCACQFLTWGFWGADLELTDGSTRAIHLANWVAGEIPPLSAISALSGTATYSGHVIGTVHQIQVPSIVYQAIGNFDMNVNFDNPSSTTTSITSFDGGNYSGSGGITLSSATASRNTFNGGLIGVSGTALGPPVRTGEFFGSFMQGGGDPAAEMGGHFDVSGADYEAAGIFAAAK